MSTFKNLPDYQILPLLQPNLDEKPFDMERVKTICARGLSKCPLEDRALAWLALLGVFPSVPNKWNETLETMRQNYTTFVSDYNLKNWHKILFTRKQQLRAAVASPADQLDNQQLMNEIHMDLVRSYRNLQYFPDDPILPDDLDPEDTLASKCETIRRIERMLYIFGQFNLTLKYMQGFNELILPLFYVMIQGKDAFSGDMDIVEAVTFHSFQNLLTNTDVKEFYSMYDNANIIQNKLADFDSLIQTKLPSIHTKLGKLRIQPIMYSYRWFNLLFAQEYQMPNLLFVWDSLLAHQPQLIEYAFFIGIALIKDASTGFSNMSDALNALQQIDENRVKTILKKTEKLWKKK